MLLNRSMKKNRSVLAETFFLFVLLRKIIDNKSKIELFLSILSSIGKEHEKSLVKEYLEMEPVTVCPRSSDPFYIVIYYKKWVTTSWTDGNSMQFTVPISRL